MSRPLLCRRRPARATKTVCMVVLMTAILVSCLPTPEPKPKPAITARELYFPLAMVADYKWQRAGYGRPWQSIGRDWQLHNRAMWSYTWGLGNCGADVPMIFSPRWAPEATELELMQACAATAPVVLVLNEPEWGSQADTTPAEGAVLLHKVLGVWGAGVYCCGNLVSHAGWMRRMVAEYKRLYGEIPAIEGVHVHVYVNDGFPVADPLDTRWIDRSRRDLTTYIAMLRELGLPTRIVVSECCLLGTHDAGVYLATMENYMTMLRGISDVETVAWFAARDPGFPHTALIGPGGTLTALGQHWLDWRWQ